MRILCALLLLAAGVQAKTYFVTVGGLGGQPDYDARFGLHVNELQKLVRAAPDTSVETLVGPAATKTALKAAIDKVATAAKAEDVFVLTLIGHGTFDGQVYKFNLPGADVSAEELRVWLEKIPARQLVVNASSASGAMVETLKRPNRVLIAATRSGNEKNATVFARYWIEAFRDAAADTDKNQVISALEAFNYADQRTTQFYESAKRLATEHAILEDTGQGEGVRKPSPENGKGLLAGRLGVVRFGAIQAAMQTPEKQALLAKKETVERQIDELKYQKAAMPVDDYKRRLQALLLELARIQEEIEK